MGGGGGHGIFLRKDANFMDVDSVEESKKNLELFDGRSNTYLGEDAGEKLKEGEGLSGSANTALGWKALEVNAVGNFNTAVGSEALRAGGVGENNTAVGHQAMITNEGNFNTAVGKWALFGNVGGSKNLALGATTMFDNIEGENNTAVGNAALYGNTEGGYNTALGGGAAYTNTTGTKNTALGSSAYCLNPSDDNSIVIGADAVGKGSNTTVIGNATSTKFFIGTTEAGVENREAGVGPPEREGYQLYIGKDGQIFRSKTATSFKA